MPCPVDHHRNPATGAELRRYDAARRGRDRRGARPTPHAAYVVWARDPARRAARPAARRRQAADRAARGVRRPDHRRDGQAARRGAGRGRQVRLELRGRRRPRARLAGRPRGRHRGASRSWLSYEPLGVVFAVMPWNFPFWQVLRFACAALAAGNAALLKHRPNVTGCALAIEELFADAGAPAGLFRTLVVAAEDVPEVVPRDRRRPAGRRGHADRQRARRAAVAVGRRRRASRRRVLELGGSDPFVVLADADLAAAAATAVRSRFGNAGQSCIARQALHRRRGRRRRVPRLFVERVALLQVGDPTAPGTTVGPMARADLRDGAACARSSAPSTQGAALVTGGHADRRRRLLLRADRARPRRAGHDRLRRGDLRPGRRRSSGPATTTTPSSWPTTRRSASAPRSGARSEHALAVGRRIRSGALFVNAMVASDPRLPFGGIGRSGYGRELSAEGIREFTNVRTVCRGAS